MPDDNRVTLQAVSPESLMGALRTLRLHGFAVTHYGGDVLNQAVGAPTNGQTWRDNLRHAVNAIAGDDALAAYNLSLAIEDSLFDLNKAGAAGVTIAKAISDGTCKAF